MQTALTHFDLTEDQIIRKNNDLFLPILRLSKILEVTPRTIQKTIQNNLDEFRSANQEFASSINNQNGILLNEEQIYLYCMLSRSKKAKEFRRAFSKMIKAIRKKEFVHITEVEKIIERTQLLNSIPKIKLNKYKKFRAQGLSRKECCKAFDLPQYKMKEADKLYGFYKPNPKAVRALKPFFFKKKDATLFDNQICEA